MYNILVCDDEKDIVEALGIYLSAEGYQVTKAYNGQEACEKLKTGDVQLVLMDIMMPVMDGITAMNEIRKMSNVPVILLTAKSEDTDKILGLSVGADDYITKPFNPGCYDRKSKSTAAPLHDAWRKCSEGTGSGYAYHRRRLSG